MLQSLRQRYLQTLGMLVVLLGALMIGLFTVHFITPAHAAGLTLSLPDEVDTNFTENFSWQSGVGASSFNLRAAYRPNMQNPFTFAQGISGSATSYSQKLDSSIGYRYFQVLAFDSTGHVIAVSNVVGLAKYQSGAMIRMVTNSDLTAEYANYASSCAGSYGYQTPVWFVPTDSTAAATRIAPNFQLGEFLNNVETSAAVVDPIMVQHMQNIRNDWGGPLTINSGYRTPYHNSQVSGSASCSTHMYGQAADVAVSDYNSWQILAGYAQQENASYIESWDEAGHNHMHADWRAFYNNPPYTNW